MSDFKDRLAGYRLHVEAHMLAIIDPAIPKRVKKKRVKGLASDQRLLIEYVDLLQNRIKTLEQLLLIERRKGPLEKSGIKLS